MITRIRLHPPLAFARVGSAEPCDNFGWGPNDLTPGGTIRTQLEGATTLDVDPDGRLAAVRPGTNISFKENDRFRKVCPFYELHAAWSDNGIEGSGPLTEDMLARYGLSLANLRWTVRVANRKAYHFTRSAGDIVQANVSMAGDDTSVRPLAGTSPGGGPNPLVLPGDSIPLGSVQLTQPFPGPLDGLRLRFTPPDGKAYAPSDFDARLGGIDADNETIEQAFKTALDDPHLPAELREALRSQLWPLVQAMQQMNNRWKGAPKLPIDQQRLNPQSAWVGWAWAGPARPVTIGSIFARIISLATTAPAKLGKLAGLQNAGDRSELLRFLIEDPDNAGNLPPGVFAMLAKADGVMTSLGLVDDVSDGFVEVELRSAQTLLSASARVVVTPPAIVPDRRSTVSLADGLMDRVNRAEVRDPRFVSGANAGAADAEVHDLLERAFETIGLQNADAVLDFFRLENDGLAVRERRDPNEAARVLWARGDPTSGEPLPLTTLARRHHRRNATPEVFEAMVRDHPDWMDGRVRLPVDDRHYYDRRMPGLMRGFDRKPLHVTRRQYELLVAWTERVSGKK